MNIAVHTVVAREDGIKLHDPLSICRLYAAQKSRLKPALPPSAHTAVDAGGIALPDVDEERGRGGLAGRDVDKLDLEVQGDAGEVFDDVAADLLAQHVVGADDVVGSQDAGAVGAENLGVGGGRGEVEMAGLVVRDAGPLGELRVVAAVEERAF
jgi:hypothetical protein